MFGIPRTRSGHSESTWSPDASGTLIHFSDRATANLAIQQVIALGIPAEALATLDGSELPRERGMLLCLPETDPVALDRAMKLCRNLGGRVHRARDQDAQTPNQPLDSSETET